MNIISCYNVAHSLAIESVHLFEYLSVGGWGGGGKVEEGKFN